MPKLTKSVVDKLASKGGRPSFAWCSEVPGFGCVLYPSGRRSFVVQYRNQSRKEHRVVLGRYGALTVDQARTKARQLLSDVALGKDPLEERQAEREAAPAPTVAGAAARYVEEHLVPKRKERSIREIRRIITVYILPRLGDRPVADVTPGEVDALHAGMRLVPIMANRVVAILSAIFTKAERWGMRPKGTNPASNTEWYPETRRERFLSSVELARVGDALAALEAEDVVKPTASAALRLLLLTGCRRNEVLHLKWSEVDLERGCLFLKDTKTGAKTLALSGQARELLASLPRMGPWVFPSPHSDEAPMHDLRKPWAHVLRRAGLSSVRLHDLRHTHASIAAQAGISLQAIEAMLGHRSTSTTAKYAHLVGDPVRAAADRVGGLPH